MLSQRTKDILVVAMADKKAGEELATAIDSGSNPQAAAVAALAGTLTGTVDGTIANVADIALSTTDTYTDAAVNSAVNAAILDLNLQLKELQTKLNAVISSLKAANIMLP